MYFPISSQTAPIGLTHEGTTYGVSRYVGDGPVDIRAPLRGSMVLYPVEPDRWSLLFRPSTSLHFPSVPGWTAPIPNIIATGYFSASVARDAVGDVLDLWVRHGRDSLSYENDSGEERRIDITQPTAVAQFIDAWQYVAVNEDPEDIFEALSIPVTARAPLVRSVGGEVFVGVLRGPVPGSGSDLTFNLDAQEYFSRLAGADQLRVLRAGPSAPWPFDGPSPDVSELFPVYAALRSEFLGGDPVARGRNHTILRGGLQRLELHLPLVTSVTIPIDILRVVPRDTTDVDDPVLTGEAPGEAYDWGIRGGGDDDEDSPWPDVDPIWPDDSGDDHPWIAEVAEEVSVRWEHFSYRGTVAAVSRALAVKTSEDTHMVTLAVQDDALANAARVAEQLLDEEADYLEWLDEELPEELMVGGVGGNLRWRDVVQIEQLLDEVLATAPSQVRSAITDGQGGPIHREYLRRQSHHDHYVNGKTELLESLVVDSEIFFDQIINSPSEHRMRDLETVFAALAATEGGREVLDRVQRSFFRDPVPGTVAPIPFSDFATLWGAASGGVRGVMSKVLVDLAKVDLLVNFQTIQSTLPSSGDDDDADRLRALLGRYDDRLSELGIRATVAPRVVDGETVSPIQFELLEGELEATVDASTHAGVLGHLDVLGSTFDVVVKIVNATRDPRRADLASLGLSVASLAVTIGETYGSTSNNSLLRFVEARALRSAGRAMGAATAVYDAVSLFRKAQDNLDEGDIDATFAYALACTGSSMIALGEGMTMTGIGAVLGVPLAITGVVISTLASLAAWLLDESTLETLVSYSVAGHSYSDTRDPDHPYHHWWGDWSRQVRGLYSVLLPPNVSASISPVFAWTVTVEPTLFDSNASRVVLRLVNDSAHEELKVDFNLEGTAKPLAHGVTLTDVTDESFELEIDPTILSSSTRFELQVTVSLGHVSGSVTTQQLRVWYPYAAEEQQRLSYS